MNSLIRKLKIFKYFFLKKKIGRWDANLGTGGSEKRVVYLAVKREPLRSLSFFSFFLFLFLSLSFSLIYSFFLATTKEEEIVPEEEVRIHNKPNQTNQKKKLTSLPPETRLNFFRKNGNLSQKLLGIY